MVEARLRWIFPEPLVIDPGILAAAARLGLSPRVTELMARRGVADATELERFFDEPPAGLHDPWLLPDARVVADRVAIARRGGERVLVFGDFDADGLTGLAILTITLRALGIDVEIYVPRRLEEGHGLSMAAVERARAVGARVIVTVDCGTTSHAEILAAASHGIDAIVTDHHRVPPVLPPALAVVNPHRPDSSYPDRRLSGSAVAFKVAELLLEGVAGTGLRATDLADLATIGGVADLAPVLGENRAIARLGLERIRSRPRPGIAALLRRAGRDPARVDLEAVAFAIAPRLNAAGRVGEAIEAARLLLADDPVEAEALAESLETANRTRRDLTRSIVDEARALADAAAANAAAAEPAVVVRGAWPVGIVGLVASRLVEDIGRPAVVGATIGETVRASCRSDGSLDLAAALESCSDLLGRHGGHAAAAGFELPVANWPAFTARFQAIAAGVVPADPRPSLRIDVAVPALAVDYAFQRDLANLGPCGPGNPEPLIAILGLKVTRVRGASGGHTQLTLQRKLDVLDGIAFDRADLAESVTEGERVDVVGRVMSRAFGGFESLQVEIRDIASSGRVPEAAAVLALDREPEAALPLAAAGGAG